MLQKLPGATFGWPNPGGQSGAFFVISQDVGSAM